MWIKVILLIILVASLVACETLPPQYKDAPARYDLKPEAAHVHVVEFIPSVDRDKWDEVRMVSCTLGFNTVSAQANINSCIHKFKNEAQSIGSELVLVKPENKRVGVDTAYDHISGHDTNCTNCVDIKGIILKPRAKAKTKISSNVNEG